MLLVTLLSFVNTICVDMFEFILEPSHSHAHGESGDRKGRASASHPYVSYDSGKGFARGDALMRHRQRGICDGSLVPLKSLKRKASDEASLDGSS
jgi:hypothetical protein